MENMIEIRNVTKQFQEYKALDDVTLTFEKGKIHGVVGRNGSGKTVLFKCICGFFKVDKGEIFIEGKKLGRDIEAPSDVGVIIENPGFLPGYSGYQNLSFLAGLKKKVSRREIKEIMERVGLDAGSNKHVGKYSLGMKQRLGIAQAIMENPSLLILDEPMNGLDNQGVEEVRRILLDLKAEGKTILIASHNREDISVLCDTVVEFDKGKILEKSFSEDGGRL